MKLIEDHHAHVGKQAIVLQPAQEDALGHVADACAQAGLVIEANLVTDFRAELAPPFPGNPCRNRPRRDPAGLQHHDLLVPSQPSIQQQLGDLGSFAGAGRSHQHQPIPRTQCLDNLRMDVPDGERFRTHKCRSAKASTVITSIKPLSMNFLVFPSRIAKTTSNAAMMMSATARPTPGVKKPGIAVTISAAADTADVISDILLTDRKSTRLNSTHRCIS